MVSLTNSPAQFMQLRLEARKSFRLDLWFRRLKSIGLDITGADLTLTVAKITGHATSQQNQVLVKKATLPTPTLGHARFDLQAAELTLHPETYAFDITMESQGFTGIIMKGELTVVDNTEFDATNSTFSGHGVSRTVDVLLRTNTTELHVGPDLPYGLTPDYVRIFEDALNYWENQP